MTTAALIDIGLIQTGDELMIRHDKNRLKVTAVPQGSLITAEAFNTQLLIAARTVGGQWKPAQRVHIDAHQPAIFS
jgi:hypothetical protein